MSQIGPKEAQRRAMRDRHAPKPRKPAPKVSTKPAARAKTPPAKVEGAKVEALPSIAPPGVCVYCDRRRERTRQAVANLRQRKEQAP